MGNERAYCRNCGHRQGEYNRSCPACSGQSFVNSDLLLEDLVYAVRQLQDRVKSLETQVYELNMLRPDDLD